MKIPITEMKVLYDRYSYLDPGESARENHDTDYCRGDSKSLHVTMGESDGIFRAYCHRCGYYGWFRYNSFPKVTQAGQSSKHRVGKSVGIGKVLRLPSDGTTKYSEWHPLARVWISKSGVTPEEIDAYGLVYSPSRHKVILPIWEKSELIGWQERALDEESPKYITVTRNSSDMLFFSKERGGDRIVVVEDALSAIRVGRTVPAVAILGAKPRDGLMLWLKRYTQFLIWLDNDTSVVKKSQVDLCNRLGIYGHCRVIKTDKDPKEYTDDEIKERVNDTAS